MLACGENILTSGITMHPESLPNVPKQESAGHASTGEFAHPGETADYVPSTKRHVSPSHFSQGIGSNGRFQILGEIAHGGMGIVYRARDTTLVRDVAIKVVKEQLGTADSVTGRFVEEARITGQLQHPGIPPVHELGMLPDGRPYLAMKLIQGRTLADELKNRQSLAQDRGRWLAVFESICQAVAYAHSNGVIHRDLKPRNIMVGEYGEVQVMDWGLAKELEKAEGGTRNNLTELSSSFDETRFGDILGTAAYMPPEQALGEIDRVDRRVDVFGLGAILAVVLTGKPAYVADDHALLKVMAQDGRLEGCFARLDASGAEADLIALAKKCLAREPEDRFDDGSAVAAAVAEFRQRAEERARQAELDRVRAEGERAKAQLHASEQRKRHRVQMALGGSVLALVLLASLGGWWVRKQAAEREREQQTQRDEKARQAARTGQVGEDTLAQLPALRKRFLWQQAEESLDNAHRSLGEDGNDALRQKLTAAQKEVRFLAELDRIRLDRSTIVGVRFSHQEAYPRYVACFQKNGFDFISGGEDQLVEQLRDSPLRAELVTAIDDWNSIVKDPILSSRFWRITSQATGEEWRETTTEALKNREALEQLAGRLMQNGGSPSLFISVAFGLERLGGNGAPVLERGCQFHPGDFWVHFSLGNLFEIDARNEPTRAIAAFRSALAVRPEASAAHTNLGSLLRATKDLQGAEQALRRAVELDPDSIYALNNLGTVLQELRRYEEAEAAYRKAIELDATYDEPINNLGTLFQEQGKLPEAIATFRQAIAVNPKSASAHYNLGTLLRSQKDLAGAIAALTKATELDPKFVKAFYNLGNALAANGNLPAALAAYRQAIALDPKHAKAHYNLGSHLLNQDEFADAAKFLRQAIALDPTSADAHVKLGIALQELKDLRGAAENFRKATKLNPKSALAYHCLGGAEKELGHLREAAKAMERAAELEPANALRHANHGLSELLSGNYPRAVESLRLAKKLQPDHKGIQKDLREAERFLELQRRLPSFKNRKERPANPAEAIEVAFLGLQHFTKDYALAYQLYSDAIAVEPSLETAHRLNAVFATVLYAAGHDPSVASLEVMEWSFLQSRAIAWFQEELERRQRELRDEKSPHRSKILSDLQGWLADPDLKSVREAIYLVAMPEREAIAWGQFWIRVRATVERANEI